jgi:hypothetical protein
VLGLCHAKPFDGRYFKGTNCCCLFATGIKKDETEGYKCHAETMMSTKS